MARPKKVNETPIIENYQEAYEQEKATNAQLVAKIAEYERICKAYAEREQQSQATVAQLKTELNAKYQYALDCAKHAYLSIQIMGTK